MKHTVTHIKPAEDCEPNVEIVSPEGLDDRVRLLFDGGLLTIAITIDQARVLARALEIDLLDYDLDAAGVAFGPEPLDPHERAEMLGEEELF